MVASLSRRMLTTATYTTYGAFDNSTITHQTINGIIILMRLCVLSSDGSQSRRKGPPWPRPEEGLTYAQGPYAYLTLPPGWASSYTCLALRPYQLGPMRIPECNHKVTGSGYKAVDVCEAETSTKALVTCSNLLSRFGQRLVSSSPPDFRNLLGHRCKAPPPRQNG